MAADSGYIVGPVLKALKVLDAVAQKGHPVSLTVISTELDLPKTSTFRYLRTLSAAGFLSYDAAADRYSVGTRFRMLANADNGIQRLRDRALPILEDMNREFNETVNLGVLSGNEIVYIAILEPTRGVRMQARVGRRDPLHSTALGKAILASLPEPERGRLISQTLPQRTFRTMTQYEAVMRQLRAVETSGIAIDAGENEDGIMCVGTPIRHEAGYPLAAISLSAPERRVTGTVRERIIDRLQAAARDISAGLYDTVPA
ncbi:IclR family transcriptional regulator [Aureimonas frigidaquae]|uniref:IclR family transcriptional regulator n=1 Tax=Aureimonas frigidaquae TaxID=424757 RepID=UPI0007840EF8|nr:IclR family transcriptional regulator [Aureimonas frigidaquae]